MYLPLFAGVDRSGWRFAFRRGCCPRAARGGRATGPATATARWRCGVTFGSSGRFVSRGQIKARLGSAWLGRAWLAEVRLHLGLLHGRFSDDRSRQKFTGIIRLLAAGAVDAGSVNTGTFGAGTIRPDLISRTVFNPRLSRGAILVGYLLTAETLSVLALAILALTVIALAIAPGSALVPARAAAIAPSIVTPSIFAALIRPAFHRRLILVAAVAVIVIAAALITVTLVATIVMVALALAIETLAIEVAELIPVFIGIIAVGTGSGHCLITGTGHRIGRYRRSIECRREALAHILHIDIGDRQFATADPWTLAFSLRRDHAVIMFGMLQVVFRCDTVTGNTGIARHLQVFFQDLMRIAPDANIRAVAVIGLITLTGPTIM